MRLDMPIVETSRLYLRPLEVEDACDLFEVYKDPRVTHYLTMKPHVSVDETLAMLQAGMLPYLKRGVPQTWVMELKESERVIGDLGIHTIEEDIGQIGYVLHPDYWGQGYMKEALTELVRVGFDHVGLRRIEALYEVEHQASGYVLKACGFVEEGRLRQYAMLQDGKYHDMILMSILKNEGRRDKDE